MNKPVVARDRGNGVWKIGTDCFGNVGLMLQTGPANEVSPADVLSTFLETLPDLKIVAITFKDDDTLLVITEPRKKSKAVKRRTDYILLVQEGGWKFVELEERKVQKISA